MHKVSGFLKGMATGLVVVADIFLRIFLDSFFGCHRHVLVAEAGGEEEGVQTVFQPHVGWLAGVGKVEDEVAGRLGCVSEEMYGFVYLYTVELQRVCVFVHGVTAGKEKAACRKQKDK